ncbi:glycoside hydrolase family 78 protein [Bacillus cereus]
MIPKSRNRSSLHIPINSFSYRAETRYFYRVKVWDNYGEESPWSEVAFWETGIQGQDNWSRNWIAAKKSARKLCLFIKAFLLKN